MSNNKAATLWMGDLEPYMDEPFIKQAFTTMGETIIYVKIMRNRYTGQPFGYGFVEFESEDIALRVLHRVNGKMIPNSSPAKRFKLNHANHGHPYNKEFSLFIGDLSPEVDDLSLYKAFSSWYPSCKVARVVLDNTGRSRGYGFVRFSEETEQRHALIQMQNFSGLGSKPIRVSLATPKNRPTPSGDLSPMANAGDYGQYGYQPSYDQYQNYYQGWTDYSQYYSAYGASTAGYTGYGPMDPSQQVDPQQAYQVAYDPLASDNSVEEHDATIDINQLNQAYLDKCDEVFEELDASRWAPAETFEFSNVEVK